MKRTKHNPPRKPKSNFIKFSKIQMSYLSEVRFRQRREWNEALESVYQELNIIEKILQSTIGTYILRQDLSGLDIVTPKPLTKKEEVEKEEVEKEEVEKEEVEKKPESKVVLKKKR